MGILTSRHGDVWEITLDWPDRRNALGPVEGAGLRLALEAAANDDTAGAIVLSANGKAFCAGGNLPEIVRLAADGEDAVRQTIYAEFQGVFRTIRDCKVPVISAVDGPAVGFGCDLALAGSATFIGTRGWLAQGWIKAGLIPATGGMLHVMRRGGPQALWWFLTADRVDGPAAEAKGLALACEDARASALAMADTFAKLPRAPLRAMVALARETGTQAHLELALDYQTAFLTDPGFAAASARLLGK